jgi:spermidine/putrescine transport system substrate-binding protein
MKKVIWLILVFLVSLVVNACGGAAPTLSSSQAGSTAEGSQATAPSSSADTGTLAKELNVYNWSDYIDEALLTKYEKDYGVKITYDTYASNEDLLAKLQAGATGYDVIFPSDYMVGQMIELGLLAEIDKSKIPNLKNMNPFNLNPPYDPDNKHCVPYQWGTTGIAYQTKVFGDTPPDRWGYLFEPEKAQQWAAAGGINVLNDQRELLGAALKYLGYSLNDTDEAHLQQAKDVILKVKPYIKTFNSEDYQSSLLVPGEVVISQAWSGDGAQAMAETTDEKTGQSQWGYVIPTEGAVVWQDNICISATSQRQATAEHFMNFLLDAQNGAAITNFTYYASPNEAAKEFINKEILEDQSIYPPKEVVDRLEWIKPLGEAVFMYDQIWTEIKSQ